jgi:DNA-binding transcriptional regulator YiaG
MNGKELIEEVCAKTDLTRKELADILGVSVGHVYNMTAGSFEPSKTLENFMRFIIKNKRGFKNVRKSKSKKSV